MFTSEKLSLALKKLSNALGRLDEAVAEPPSSIQSDAVLQRFEFTFELCWKALRIYLAEAEGIEVTSPKGTLKAAFRHGLIQGTEEQQFLQMLEDRNTSAHVYDERESHEIFARVRDSHLPSMKGLLPRIKTES